MLRSKPWRVQEGRPLPVSVAAGLQAVRTKQQDLPRSVGDACRPRLASELRKQCGSVGLRLRREGNSPASNNAYGLTGLTLVSPFSLALFADLCLVVFESYSASPLILPSYVRAQDLGHYAAQTYEYLALAIGRIFWTKPSLYIRCVVRQASFCEHYAARGKKETWKAQKARRSAGVDVASRQYRVECLRRGPESRREARGGSGFNGRGGTQLERRDADVANSGKTNPGGMAGQGESQHNPRTWGTGAPGRRRRAVPGKNLRSARGLCRVEGAAEAAETHKHHSKDSGVRNWAISPIQENQQQGTSITQLLDP